VIISHTIAAISAEIIVTCVILEVSTSPIPTVLATAVPDNAPTKFNIVAIATAALGVKALVDTEVAIAVAVSWKPFIKSNTSARTITQTSKKKVSGMFEDYSFKYVGNILAFIRCILKVLVDLLPFDNEYRILYLIKQMSEGISEPSV